MRCCIISLLLVLIIGQTSSFGQELINLGNRRELFVDHYLIDQLNNVELRMHIPKNEGPVLYFDKPWEKEYSAYCTMIKDGDLYRLYYRGAPKLNEKGDWGDQTTCYAESRDGKNWSKPSLRIHLVQGTLDNNVILVKGATHNFSPFIDHNPKAPRDERYKAVGGSKRSGLIPYVSPDGIHWKKLKEEGVIHGGAFDSQNVVFWSESEKQYICYFRIFEGTADDHKFRAIARTTSHDFINWTKPVSMTFGNTPMEHFYTQQTSPYFRAPHIYLAIGARFMENRQVIPKEEAKKINVDPIYFKDCSDVFLMSTRGGNNYTRTFMESFIRPGIGYENWISRSNYPVLNVIETGPEEISIYVNEDYAQSTAHIKRYSLRTDGFISITAPYKGGYFVTKPFTFAGEELEINYSTSAAGEIQVEIQDELGKPLSGFSINDADKIIGNQITRIVSWKGHQSLKNIKGRPVRLKVLMKDADLFSLKFN